MTNPDYNRIYLSFAANEGVYSSASFLVEVGLRLFDKVDDDDDDIELPKKLIIIPPITRGLQYSEGLIMIYLLIGVAIFVLKLVCCPNLCKLKIKPKPTLAVAAD